MKLLFLGDVVGRSGRTAVIENLPRLRAAWKLDFVVVNGENATNGAGLSGDHAKQLLDAGADVLTLGDHAFDQKDMMTHIESEPRIIRRVHEPHIAQRHQRRTGALVSEKRRRTRHIRADRDCPDGQLVPRQ